MQGRDWTRAIPGVLIGVGITGAWLGGTGLLRAATGCTGFGCLEFVWHMIALGPLAGAVGGVAGGLLAGRRGRLPVCIGLADGLLLSTLLVDPDLVAATLALAGVPASVAFGLTIVIRGRRRSPVEHTAEIANGPPPSAASDGDAPADAVLLPPASRRGGLSTALALATLAAIPLVVLGGPIALEWLDRLGCPAGRECVRAAGVSLNLPDGWHAQPRDDEDILFAAAPSYESPFGLMIKDPSGDLGEPAPTDLDGVERALRPSLTQDGGFTRYETPVFDRVTLPIGPALRLRYTQTTAFIFAYHSAITSYWCFVDGRLIEILYVDSFGENEAAMPSDLPIPQVRMILDSLEPLPSDA